MCFDIHLSRNFADLQVVLWHVEWMLNNERGISSCTTAVAMQRLIRDEAEVEVNLRRQSVGQSVLVSGTHLAPATNFSPSPFN
jgi:hypothetical protein